MMTCPECGRKESLTTVKCECGHWFPPSARRKEERRLADGPAERSVATGGVDEDARFDRTDRTDRYRWQRPRDRADRYTALRLVAKIYRLFGWLALVVGAAKILLDAATWVALVSGSTVTKADVVAPMLAVVVDLLGTAFAVVTSFAIAEAIGLLLDLSGRATATAATPSR